jgi:DNA-binding Lrp family transcriptional regulator
MSCVAYVLVVIDPGLTSHVHAVLADVAAVVDRHLVTGPYDVVVKLRAESMDDFSAILRDDIRTIPGIVSTTTLIAFPSRPAIEDRVHLVSNGAAYSTPGRGLFSWN